MLDGVCVTITLLMCVVGGQAMDLLRATTASGSPPSAPTVHCSCSSYLKRTICSWPEALENPPTHYIATYRERHNQEVIKSCDLIPPDSSDLSSSSSTTSEKMWQCELPNLKLLTDYVVNITAVNSAGSKSDLSVFMLEKIVKPDPPVNVSVSSHNGRRLLVEWSPPSTWAKLDIFPLKYQILYQWENLGVPKSATLGPIERTRFELKGLTPGREYTFQVCAIDLLDLGECSKWSSPVNVTIAVTKP